jgi:hypothetical protein
MSKHLRVIQVIAFVLIVVSGLTAQNKKISVIKGIVTDSETKEPLIAASVYFVETTIGTTVAANGEYTLKVVKPGNYEMIVSMVGYNIQKKKLFIERGKTYTFDFSLQPKPMNLNPVVVEGDAQSEWNRCLKIFTRKFLGTLRPAEDCVIENKEYIDFKWLGDTLSATVRRPLVIANNYLGYKIVCEITKYRYNTNTTYQEYAISSRFIEMEPKDSTMKKEWEIHRKDMYYGSPTHFLWSLKHNKMETEGYDLFFVPSLKKGGLGSRIEKSKELRDSIRFRDKEVFSFPDYIKINYKGQISWIQLRFSYFTIDSNGIADNHIPFLCYGFWANLGLASMLPRDYMPEPLKEQNY